MSQNVFAELLEPMGRKERARIWCALNKFEWPADLIDFKPDGWDEADLLERMNNQAAMLLWRTVNEMTTYKECLREWNSHKWTDEMFELWWSQKTKAK